MSDKAPVAIVTGASRGAGQGIARALGSHGCTVYVTGRTLAAGQHNLAGTIGETAEMVTQAGGKGIAIKCDHSRPDEVKAFFEQVMAEQGRIDILVNNAAAVYDELNMPGGFWERPLKLGDMIDVGIRSSFDASWYAAQAMVAQNNGLIVFTSGAGAEHYVFSPAYGAHKAGMDKMAFDMGMEFDYAQLECRRRVDLDGRGDDRAAAHGDRFRSGEIRRARGGIGKRRFHRPPHLGAV